MTRYLTSHVFQIMQDQRKSMRGRFYLCNLSHIYYVMHEERAYMDQKIWLSRIHFGKTEKECQSTLLVQSPRRDAAFVRFGLCKFSAGEGEGAFVLGNV